MTIEESMVAYLATVTAVTTLVGTRVYPCALPQDPVLPAVVYQRTGATRDRSGSGPTNLVEATYMLTVWGETYSSAKAVARVVRDALDGAAGPWSGVELGLAQADDTRDDYNSDLFLYGAAVELTIQYKEA